MMLVPVASEKQWGGTDDEHEASRCDHGDRETHDRSGRRARLADDGFTAHAGVKQRRGFLHVSGVAFSRHRGVRTVGRKKKKKKDLE